MSLFKQKEIPETPMPQVKKKGLGRLIELIDRDGGKFFRAGLLAVLGLVPFTAAVIAAVAGGITVALLACIPAGMIAAPELCGVADTVMRSLRDEVGWWWWDTYKTAWKRNLRACIIPGGIFGFVTGLQIFSLYLIAALPNPTAEFFMLFAATMVELGILNYYLPMLVCMELPALQLLRNCFVLFFSHPIKSLLAALGKVIYYMVILTWFPLTGVLFVASSVWLPMIVACNTLYPVLDRHFNLTETYRSLRRQHWGEDAE